MSNIKVAVVFSDYYPEISAGLIQGVQFGVERSSNSYDIEYFNTHGTFEIPLQIEKVIDRFDAVLALGCVVQGKTYHHELINNSVIPTLLQMSIRHKKPIGTAILTVKSLRQAIKRSQVDDNNRGLEAFSAVDKFFK